MDYEHFLSLHPTLYHMAWENAWPGIQTHGLLSTEALLDLFEYSGEKRNNILYRRRPESIPITHHAHGIAVIRDQKPISDIKLQRCLTGGLTPSDWYAYLNKRVFFWATQDRLFKLMCAKAYASKRHCVLEFDAASLVADYGNKILFSPINSGATFTDSTLRGRETFTRITDFPYAVYRSKSRHKLDIYVELTVEYAVKDISKYVKKVYIMQGQSTIESIYP